MSEAFLDRLSQFTPNAGGLDRDALLFAAGRASARPGRGWIAFATVVTSTQVLSLVFLWARPPSPADQFAMVVSSRVPESTTDEPELSTVAGTGIWSTRRGMPDSDPEIANPADDAVSLIDSGPPLRASGPLPASLLN
jgi:hypothetical protein